MIVAREGLKALRPGAQKLFLKMFEFDLLEVVDARGEFVVPTHSCVFVDAEFFGDAAEAHVAGAEFDELVFGFEGVHKLAES
jgi:hypothetical protein